MPPHAQKDAQAGYVLLAIHEDLPSLLVEGAVSHHIETPGLRCATLVTWASSIGFAARFCFAQVPKCPQEIVWKPGRRSSRVLYAGFTPKLRNLCCFTYVQWAHGDFRLGQELEIVDQLTCRSRR